jgi:hypothetical protein
MLIGLNHITLAVRDFRQIAVKEIPCTSWIQMGTNWKYTLETWIRDFSI